HRRSIASSATDPNSAWRKSAMPSVSLLLLLWVQLFQLPTATQCSDQLHAGSQATAQQGEVAALIVQRGGLYVDHAVEIDGTGAVLVLDQAQCLARRIQRLLLHVALLLQHAQLHQVVLHFAEAVQHGL